MKINKNLELDLILSVTSIYKINYRLNEIDFLTMFY